MIDVQFKEYLDINLKESIEEYIKKNPKFAEEVKIYCDLRNQGFDKNTIKEVQSIINI